MPYPNLKVGQQFFLPDRNESVTVLAWNYNQVVVRSSKGLLHLSHFELPSCPDGSYPNPQCFLFQKSPMFPPPFQINL